MTELRSINVQLAAMLLLQHGQISINEIKALPLVESRDEALFIADRICDAFSERYDLALEDGESLVIAGLATQPN